MDALRCASPPFASHRLWEREDRSAAAAVRSEVRSDEDAMAAERGGGQDLMDYEALTQAALRGVIRSALERGASPGGLPGAHHLYVTFRTRGAGVSIPADLAEKYPEEMTIVLQHQYWDLKPEADRFSVTLSFGGQPKVLTAPYGAITRFYDPSVQFLLQFESTVEEAPPAALPHPVSLHPERRSDAAAPSAEPGEGPPEDTGPKIVSLDKFRKK